ncbi:MAG: tripartite tricarboxylate transporter substrate binding protein [Phyllobacteriaceae bacterium]|jgi:tripartite-type tricarboxylate transporter receptor subunit TctC|nr:tripartite tricarboxylate transporter substrate binding protein [Phyllobacteriaceae bacterium]
MKRRVALKVLAASVMAASLPAVGHAEGFPDKEITLIVNYGAGGGTDLSARVLAKGAEEFLGQPIRVVNKTGGSGTVGPTNIAAAEADGYTIGIASFSPMAVSPHLTPVAYSLDSFDFILGHARYRSGISVGKDSPYQTIEDFLDAARSGQEITYAATDTLTKIFMAKLQQELGADFKAVNYKSGQESVTATIAGVVDFNLEGPTNVVPQVKSDNLRLLASVSSVPWFEMPDVPTIKDAGVDLFVESYAGLAAPAGVPEDRLKVLEDAFAQALNDPEVQKTMSGLGMEPAYFSSAEYRTLLEEGYASMDSDLEIIGLK